VSSPDSRTVGYRNCLDSQSDHHLFEEWFKTLELSSLQKKKKIGILESVRTAVKDCVQNTRHIYFDIDNDELMFDFQNDERCPFSNLSDGYKNMVGMVADIAHRAARLNPHFGEDAAKQSSGVVLIDEIDLHLHPKWQRKVVSDLKRTFPNIQFIATTHSPFIIQQMEPGEVIDLNNVGEIIIPTSTTVPSSSSVAMPAPKNEYSDKSIEDITEDVMGVELPQRSNRLKEMYKTAKEYYTLLENAKNADEKIKNDLKQKLDELSAPFSDNVAYHAFLEMKRISVGIEHENGEND
jgi:predicted ATP-binding protein involved in virulence